MLYVEVAVGCVPAPYDPYVEGVVVVVAVPL